MRTEIKNFERQELFDMFNSYTNPFSFVTTRIDITKIYKLCGKKKNYYATIGYYLTLALNEVEEFKYTYKDGHIYKYDKLNPSFADIRENNIIGFLDCHINDNYDGFIKEYLSVKQKFLKGENSSSFSSSEGIVWMSCEPWFNFSSVIPPFDKDITVPQLIWDKFIIENEHCYINLMIMVHHGFVDGYHIGKLIDKINEIIDNIK